MATVKNRAASAIALFFAVACSRQPMSATPTPAPTPASAGGAQAGAAGSGASAPLPVQTPPAAGPPQAVSVTAVPLTAPEEPQGHLPAIPVVAGAPLKLTVVYPARDQLITSRDSNFVLGSVGSGDATLAINGVPVEVKPNGAWLAWLPIPPGTTPVYHL